MRSLSMMAALLFAGGASHAGGLDIHVMLSGEVVPGVYGEVTLGGDRPPPVVYAQPMLIEPQEAPPPPIYLHVPPSHARDWRRHCREYHACNRPVYFVRSAEYDPGYDARLHQRERAEAEERQYERERERQEHERWHEREEHRDYDRDHDRDDDRDRRDER